jgi:hypothetical protein
MQRRCKQAGMQWGEAVQNVLSLRAKMESDLWDAVVVPLVNNYQFKPKEFWKYTSQKNVVESKT